MNATTTCLSMCIPAAAMLPNTNPIPIYGRRRLHGIPKSRASSSSSSSTVDFDLYDLLGIHSSSDQSQIKQAYRSLQKRCHPDIAGPTGHDMAIILNEAYAVLSNPSSRLAYDKEQAKTAEFRGYTGKPVYSAWFGSQSEERAVFVDEVKCVGCLKCALFANKTFAVESAYGRARVVAQWADPEHKIQEAIDACPVDCISFVERSNLAALEFLMLKQPRGNVRVGVGNTVGVRVSNIFADVKKFQSRYDEARDKVSSQYSKETDLQREARMSAVQAIRSISNWFYWKTPNSGASAETAHRNLIKTNHKSTKPDIGKLRDAASARKKLSQQSAAGINRKNFSYHEDYWIPSTHALPESSQTIPKKTSVCTPTNSAGSSPMETSTETKEMDNILTHRRNRSNPTVWVIPLATATIAALNVKLQGVETVGRLEHHAGGYLALQIVNSSWLPVILSAISWYVIGVLAVGFIQAFTSRES